MRIKFISLVEKFDVEKKNTPLCQHKNLLTWADCLCEIYATA